MGRFEHCMTKVSIVGLWISNFSRCDCFGNVNPLHIYFVNLLLLETSRKSFLNYHT